MPIAALKNRYDAFAERLLASLSEIERRDVRSFDRWFFSRGLALAGGTDRRHHRVRVAVGAQLPWNMTFGRSVGAVQRRPCCCLVWVVGVVGVVRLPPPIRDGSFVAWWSIPVVFLVLGTLAGALAVLLVNLTARILAVFPGGTTRGCGMASHRGAGVFSFPACVLLVALISQLRNREYAALTARLEAEARQSDLSRQLAESKLKLLQLQIEPHFLFNTLGSYSSSPKRAHRRQRA